MIGRLLLCLTLVLCGSLVVPFPALAATYYVSNASPVGSDANNGLSLPLAFLTLQKGLSVLAPGDTLLVNDGTYQDNSTWSPGKTTGLSGTSIAPIIVKSINPLGAKVLLPSPSIEVANSPNTGFYLTKSWYTFDGFEVSGGTSLANANTGYTTGGSLSGLTIKNGYAHGMAHGICSNGGFGNAGIFIGNAIFSTITIDNMIFGTIGRLVNGESGCVTTHNNNDHDVYIDGANGSITGITVSHSTFYDTTRGWPIHVYGTGSPNSIVNNLNIWNNTFADHCTLASGCMVDGGHILLSYTVNGASIKNNISYNPFTAFVYAYPGGTPNFTNVVIDYNLTNSANVGTNGSTTTWGASPPTGITVGTHNILSTDPLFTNQAARNYTLTAGSPAINAGTNVGLSGCVGTCDIGASEFGAAADTTPPAVPRGLTVQ